MDITIIPVKVQGDDAAYEMINAIELANTNLDSDVIVLTRGGGSMEDLWAFNNEELAYAIRASHIPVVSAVGHEIDFTISDLVSDFRAPTPSAAAELLVAEKESLKERISDKSDRLYNAVNTSIKHLNSELSLLLKGLRDPKRMIADSWMHLDELNNQLVRLVNLYLKETASRLASEGRALLSYSPSTTIESLCQRIQFQKQSLLNVMFRNLKENQMELSLFEEKIKDLSPLSVLKRGYSITRMLPEKVILKNTYGIRMGDRVNILLAEGDMDCRVEKIIK
jgi:exodeoxyribonuclease VII large subunit